MDKGYKQIAEKLGHILFSNEIIKKLESDKVISEDERFKTQEETQKITDKYMAELENSKRQGNFDEVEFGYTEQQAVDEGKRCYKCHYRLKISHPMQPPVTVKSV